MTEPNYIRAVEWPYPVNYGKENEVETDVLVLGGGIASCHAAINAAKRGAKVIQNLLAFARRRQPKKEYSDLNNIVQSALELRAYQLKTSNIEVTTNLAPGLPEIMLDFHQIQEVFLNIILNAEQAITEANGGGKLTIKTEKNKMYVRITFSDDGPGIPPENLDSVFDPFFTTKEEKGGTGLGLSICHGIITEHGGKIYAKSKPGKGTMFFIELPN
jgi:two-component system NtrC family sensor kinase